MWCCAARRPPPAVRTNRDLMAELASTPNSARCSDRVIDRKMRECPAPHQGDAAALVLDATTGQNGLIQAMSAEAAGLTGIVLTKLDGTSPRAASSSPSLQGAGRTGEAGRCGRGWTT